MARLKAAVLLGLFRVLAVLPITFQRAIGRALGDLAWYFNIRAARITRINLTICMPQCSAAEIEQLTRESLRQTGQLLAEAGLIFHWPERRWRSALSSIEGQSLLETALAQRRGVLLLVPHLGNWEYLSLFLGQYAVTALYDRPRLGALEVPLRKARSRSGAHLVPIGRRGIKVLRETLSSGGLVALLPDQVPERSSGMYVDFFRHPALTMTLAGALIARTHPCVLTAVAFRTRGGFGIRIAEAEADVYAADPARVAAAINRSIEKLVCQAPDQYQWEYKRFKRPPPGMADPYGPQGAR